MSERRDKLGRRIPDFDRSAAGKKSAKTQKEKYGDDYHKRIGTRGASMRTRGHFGKLKAEGKTAKIKAYSKEAVEARKAKKSESETESTREDGTSVRGAE